MKLKKIIKETIDNFGDNPFKQGVDLFANRVIYEQEDDLNFIFETNPFVPFESVNINEIYRFVAKPKLVRVMRNCGVSFNPNSVFVRIKEIDSMAEYVDVYCVDNNDNNDNEPIYCIDVDFYDKNFNKLGPSFWITEEMLYLVVPDTPIIKEDIDLEWINDISPISLNKPWVIVYEDESGGNEIQKWLFSMGFGWNTIYDRYEMIESDKNGFYFNCDGTDSFQLSNQPVEPNSFDAYSSMDMLEHFSNTPIYYWEDFKEYVNY